MQRPGQRALVGRRLADIWSFDARLGFAIATVCSASQLEPSPGTMKKVLMVAYHYPPVQGSSGVHRTLYFTRYLPELGWDPIVLTVTPRAYPNIERRHSQPTPEGVMVERAFAIDAARHLGIGGRHLKLLALPDRWISWWLSGVLKGLTIIRRHRPNVLWSTYPIATAHLIGLTLERLTGVPWVADFRDPMTEIDPLTGEQHPRDPAVRSMYGSIERATVRRATKVVLTTPGAARMYRERYSSIGDSKLVTIANGFDEDSFRSLAADPLASRHGERPMKLLHSGLLYPEARDPRPLLAALGELRQRNEISARTLRVIFRGSGHDDLFRSTVDDFGIGDIVSFEPLIPYAEALNEMITADGLLVLQGANCNAQIPAKLYEYLRAGRPILALTDSRGDTASVLLQEGIETVAPLDSKDQIVAALRAFLQRLKEGTAPIPNEQAIQRHSRKAKTEELASLLNSVLHDEASASNPKSRGVAKSVK